jgi:thiol-disulfide isomerase/thioredoxin
VDRLSTVGALALGLGLACSGGESTEGKSPPRSRVNAVAATPKPQEDLAEWCEIRADPQTARKFAFPRLAGDVAFGPGWRWVNVWATWCKPCLEEMPMLAGWRERLAREKVAVDMVFLSVDADAETVAELRKSRPEIPEGPRIASVDDLPQWMESIGLDESSVLPIHMFVDPTERIRCVRMGGIAEHDYDTVKRVVTQE